MLNKLLDMLRSYRMVEPGDRIICAVSGGADSMALLWSFYLLREKLDIQLAAAHFNHQLRGAESDGDEAFVRQFCRNYEIPLYVGTETVVSGEKGLEAAAREARYAFFRTLPGKIATAHTCDDNAETVLLHLVRGTGLKGLGGIAPIRDNLIRPMLGISRRDVENFLQEYHIPHVDDSSNDSDQFLRNRLRHHVMPMLKEENPRLAENLSAMALRLRQDEEALSEMSKMQEPGSISALQAMSPAQRCRALETFLKENGVKEPEAEHLSLAERLVFSNKPSAMANFPGNVTIARKYDRLYRCVTSEALETMQLPVPGVLELPQFGLRVICKHAEQIENGPDVMTVVPKGEICLRHRMPGDEIRLPGGTKSLKKLFIDRKIPSAERDRIPVVCDEEGILGVWKLGVNTVRQAEVLPAVQIRFEIINTDNS